MEEFDITIKCALNELSIGFRKVEYENKEEAKSTILEDIDTLQDIQLTDSDLEWV